ncbi:hypothetical protein Nepgr_009238 [Nepenthes gracilis]|uniref:Transmembrane protein n=1 Tax=Nepenthes gracilis TaxID=150966 RepID=A0AAD3SA62_NEPGR|nr:hypothetical protein Nepgr_009238 [Nepenthes gracilis]
MAARILSLSSPPPSTLKPKSPYVENIHNSNLQFTSLLTLSILSVKTAIHSQNPPQKRSKIWKPYATSGDSLSSEAVPVEGSQQIISTNDDSISTIVSVLLFIAFIVLSILTIGVVYIGVTDFLQKREKEKFEKEEATNKKKGGKVRIRARAGPRGFGQKIDENDNDVDDDY